MRITTSMVDFVERFVTYVNEGKVKLRVIVCELDLSAPCNTYVKIRQRDLRDASSISFGAWLISHYLSRSKHSNTEDSRKAAKEKLAFIEKAVKLSQSQSKKM